MSSVVDTVTAEQPLNPLALIPGLPNEIGTKILSYLPAIEIPKYLDVRGNKDWWGNRFEIYTDVLFQKESLNRKDLRDFQKILSIQLHPEKTEVSAAPSKSLVEIFEKLSFPLRNLKHLDLSFDSTLTDEELIAILKYCPNLTSINLACTSISNDSLIELGKCHQLTSINLKSCTRIKDAGLQTIAQGCPNLESIDLDLHSLNEKSIKLLVNSCPKLQRFCLSNCKISTGLFSNLEPCPSMKRLVLNQCEIDDGTMAELISLCPNLESIDLSFQNKVGDKSIKALGDYCPNLKKIDAQSCAITDASLPVLETLKNLTSINLVGCKKLTRDKIKAFRKAHHPHIMLLV